MKVLFVTPYYKPYLGGIERVIEKLSEYFFQSEGIEEVGVMTSKWSFPRKYNNALKPKEKLQYESIIRIPSWPQIAPPFFQVPLVWFSPWQIKKVIDEFQPDVIQLMNDRWFWVNGWTVFWAKKKNIPVFFSLSFHELSLLQQILRIINYFITNKVAKVQVITQYEEKLIRESYGTKEESITVIPWGVEFPETKLKKEPNQDAIVRLVAVGRISKHKGQLWLADLCTKIKTETPIELVLVGDIEDTSQVASIEKISHENNLSVIINGHVTDQELEYLYKNSDIFVLFPEYEAFGLVFLEAMARGLPVVTHDVGAIKEVLGNGALVVPKFDSDSAIVAIQDLVNQKELRRELSRQGAKWIKERYSWKKTAKSFIQLYNQAV